MKSVSRRVKESEKTFMHPSFHLDQHTSGLWTRPPTNDGGEKQKLLVMVVMLCEQL